jgi:hypothetical protein
VKTLSLKLRFGAALLAVGASTSIVWSMSSYAYPETPTFIWGELAHRVYAGACSS